MFAITTCFLISFKALTKIFSRVSLRSSMDHLVQVQTGISLNSSNEKLKWPVLNRIKYEVHFMSVGISLIVNFLPLMYNINNGPGVGEPCVRR